MKQTALIEGVKALGISLSDRQLQQFSIYAQLLEDWNQRMNLTAVPRKDFETLHFLDSLSAAPLIDSLKPSRAESLKLLDVGTGAGFPGIPLKILWPHIQLYVLDSIRKKLSFIETLSRELGIDVKILCARAEIAAHDPENREQFDIVVSRAVAPLEVLVHWMAPFLRIGGLMCALKSSEVDQEKVAAEKSAALLGLSHMEVNNISLPIANIARGLVTARKLTNTPTELSKRKIKMQNKK